MRVIPLDPVPNQSMSVTLDGNRWDITLKECNGVMCASLVLNDAAILSGQRLVAGVPFIPYRYLQTSGNFWILTDSDQLPDYTRFGIDQEMVYVSFGEL